MTGIRLGGILLQQAKFGFDVAGGMCANPCPLIMKRLMNKKNKLKIEKQKK